MRQPVRIGYASPGAGSLPIWVASEAGIFEANGLDIEVSLIHGTASVVEALAGGEISYANIASPPLFHAVLHGSVRAVYLTGGITSIPHQVVVRGDSGIDRPSDLRNRVFGLRSSNGTQLPDVDSYLLEKILPRIGIGTREVDRVLLPPNHASAIEALERGHVDAVTLVAPYAIEAERRGMKSVVDSFELRIPFQLGGLVGTRGAIAANPALAAALVRSYVEAVHHLHADKPHVVEIIRKYSGIESDQVAAATYDTFARYYRRVPCPSDDGIRAVLELLADHGITGAMAFGPEDLVDITHLEALERSGFIDGLYA